MGLLTGHKVQGTNTLLEDLLPEPSPNPTLGTQTTARARGAEGWLPKPLAHHKLHLPNLQNNHNIWFAWLPGGSVNCCF